MFDSVPFGTVGQLLLGWKVKPSRFQLVASPGDEETAAFCAQPAAGPAQAV